MRLPRLYARALAASLLVSLGCASQPPIEGLEPLEPPSGVTVRALVETYPVNGSDRATVGLAIRNAITDETGHRFAGFHRSTITWRYVTRREGQFCSVARVTVMLTSIVTLPSWTPPAEADSALVADWIAFRRALAVHERGHRERAYAAAGQVQRALRDLTMQGCQSLQASARTAADPLLVALRAEQAMYDAETRHGATQGAVWLRP